LGDALDREEFKMNELNSIAILELSRIDWKNLRDIRSCHVGGTVSADYVPVVIAGLLKSKSEEEADTLYWKIENNVFVQGQLFEAAEYLIPILMASLLEISEDFVKCSVHELIYQIVAGVPHQHEMALGNVDLGKRCRSKAREGLWILYRELLSDGNEMVYEILEKIETDSSRLEFFRKESEKMEVTE
jgi:hypothetical protein